MAPDAEGGVLMDAQAAAGDFLLLHYLRDVVDELEVCPLFPPEAAGSSGAAPAARVKVPLPGKGAYLVLSVSVSVSISRGGLG